MKISKLLVGGLTAIMLSCSPGLSTPENTVKTFLTEIKNGNDPLDVCGYDKKNKELNFVYYQSGNLSRKGHNYCSADPKCFKEVYSDMVEKCLPDLDKCITFSGLPSNLMNQDKYKQFLHSMVLDSGSETLEITLQKEEDGTWRIAKLYGPKQSR